jgi:hypothetical protein
MPVIDSIRPHPSSAATMDETSLEQEPPLGAHLTTSRWGYSHHGVYVGHGRVVHYSGLSGFWQCGPVEEVSLFQFVDGHPVRIISHPESPFSPEEIVRRARSRLGENAYRLLTNNCEHFCNWSLSGISRSAQVERRMQLPFRILGALGRALQMKSPNPRLQSSSDSPRPMSPLMQTDGPSPSQVFTCSP